MFILKDDKRPQKGLWAPGDYMCTCIYCGTKFGGDKRAVQCADCAYGSDTITVTKDKLNTILTDAAYQVNRAQACDGPDAEWMEAYIETVMNQLKGDGE